MHAERFYSYLRKARRELWTSLRTLSDEDLSRAVLPTEGARCIKDLVFHIAAVEDGWFHLDLLGKPMVQVAFGLEPTSEDTYWHHETEPLEKLLAYWEAVEADTLQLWPELMAVAGSDQKIKAFDDRTETLSADEVLWHVMQHEVRHTAHIVQMMRLLGHKPPSLDYVFLMAH
ncbi:DinB family protein [Deinococcus roseus]|uniref:Damage-inducible protein DinB n=1 Tax=Deinococcus roseus TaxID=392414 RepID=A0ABQ2CUD9_9DEIO|nr:DinB family protein [Deinococcus roseus]GGJ21767.1 damage-inducible protein DinB [Deinococcus roseus]